MRFERNALERTIPDIGPTFLVSKLTASAQPSCLCAERPSPPATERGVNGGQSCGLWLTESSAHDLRRTRKGRPIGGRKGHERALVLGDLFDVRHIAAATV